MGKMCISGILVYFLVRNINWVEVWGYFRAMDSWFVVLSIVFYIGGLMISAQKWRILARYLSFEKDFLFYIQTYIFGTFLNNFFPSFVGGDTYRIFALGKKEKRLKDASATVVADRISGLFGTIILAVLCSVFNIREIIDNTVVFFIVCGFGVFLAVSGFLIIFYHATYIQTVMRRMPHYVIAYANTLLRFRKRHIGAISLLYVFVFAFVGVACANYMLFLAMDVQLSFINFISVVFLTNIIAAAPISIGNIGTKEWAYVFLFGLFGVSGSAAVAVVLLSRVIQMIISFAGIPFFLQERKKVQEGI